MGSYVSMPGESLRQRRAAQLRAQMEPKYKPAPKSTGPGAAAVEEPAELVPQGTGPVGAGEYVIKLGECIASIAKDEGHFWKTIWNDPANGELTAARSNPDLLLPGDRLVIPAKRRKSEPGQTEIRHRFRRRGEPASLHFILKDVAGRPRCNEPYVMEIDGKIWDGATDPNGQVNTPIAGNARSGSLTLTRTGEKYSLQLGSLAPITEIVGIQGRLRNLGFDCGGVDGVYGTKTRAAVAAFQKRCGLEPTGVCDEATRSKLRDEHRC